jgi:hypothetical protein
MWTGSPADLERILRLVQKQYEPLIEDHIASATEHPRQMLAMKSSLKSLVEGSPASDRSAAEIAEINADVEARTKALEEAKEEASKAGRIDLALTGREDERRAVTGTAAELTQYLDGRHVHALEFSAPSGNIRNHSISIRADRKDGIYARVSSNDSQWCIAAFAELSDEIKKQVSKWPFLRNAIFLYFAYTVMIGVALWFAADTVAIWTTASHKFTREVASTITTVIGILAPTLGMVSVFLTRKLIPAFEVVDAGQGSRGRRLLTAVGSVLGALVLAVVGNAVSKAVLGS